MSLPRGFEVVAETESLTMYINPTTMEIAVSENSTGTVWFSNPQGAAKAHMPQLIITYFLPGDIKKQMDSYNHSVAFDQSPMSKLSNGVRIDYTLGLEWKDEDYIPVMMDEEQLNELVLDRIEDAKVRELFEKNYTLLVIEERPEGQEAPAVFQVDTKKLLGDNALVILKTKNSRLKGEKEALELLLDQVVARTADLKGRSAVTTDHIAGLVGNPTYVLNTGISAWDRQDMVAALKEIGFTPQSVIEAHEFYGLDVPIRNVEVFKVPVEYVLDGDAFIATIPASEIVYPVNVVNAQGATVTMPLTDISLLPFFGAANASDEGYIFVPDGCGTLIRLNNGKTYASPYRRAVYGDDISNLPDYSRSGVPREIPKETVYLPVFGMKRLQGGFLCIIEQGEALASICADIAGRTNPYNTVYAEFNIIPYEEVWIDRSHTIGWINERVSNRTSANAYQSRPNQGDLTVRYVFLDADDADYVGMAQRYRDYLVENTGMTRLSSGGDIPLFLELVGAIYRNRPVMGLPRQVVEPLTTYAEAKDIVSEFIESGVTNVRLRYSGWLQGGLRHSFPAGAKLERKLGTERDLLTLAKFVEDNGGRLYPDVSFINVYKDQLFDGFKAANDAARKLDRSVARTLPSSTGGSNYVLSPTRLASVITAFVSDYAKLGIDGLSLRYIGTQLSSDFRSGEGNLVDRQDALAIHTEQLRRLVEDEGFRLMLSGANRYAIPYADSVVNLALDHSNYAIADQSVPFYQIVTHGFVNYAGTPINLAPDPKRAKLQSIEMGAYPYYLGFYAEGQVIKGTDFNYLYSAHYRDWLDDALEFYREANSVLREVQNRLIIDHEQLIDGVFRTTYEGGLAIIVNYNSYDLDIDGVRIGSQGYAVVEEVE